MNVVRRSPRMSKQQRGYGRGEGLLFRKYPLKAAGADSMYGGASWLGGLFGSARIYYGAFGRGLFQSVYPGAETSPLLQLPLTMPWVAIAIVMIVGRPRERTDGSGWDWPRSR